MNFFYTFTNLFEEDKKSLFQKNSGKKISLLFSFLLIAAIFYAQGDCSQVPNSISGFIYMGEHNGSKYFCSDNNNHNWLSAKTAAAANGGHLVVINDQSENDFIKNGIMASAAWIGYSDEITEGSFEWMDGSQSAYTNWSGGEPSTTKAQAEDKAIIRL
ncbi:MAG: lectin-like protein [Saprospiraceae bacterium]